MLIFFFCFTGIYKLDWFPFHWYWRRSQWKTNQGIYDNLKVFMKFFDCLRSLEQLVTVTILWCSLIDFCLKMFVWGRNWAKCSYKKSLVSRKLSKWNFYNSVWYLSKVSNCLVWRIQQQHNADTIEILKMLEMNLVQFNAVI